MLQYANTPKPKNRDSVEQDQFLTILSREDALARFEAALFPRALPRDAALADALGHALAEDVVAPIDVPPFDAPMSTVLRCVPPTLHRPAKPCRFASRSTTR